MAFLKRRCLTNKALHQTQFYDLQFALTFLKIGIYQIVILLYLIVQDKNMLKTVMLKKLCILREGQYF